MRAYLALFRNNMRLTARDRGVLFFNYLFPLIFFFIFGQLMHAEQGGVIVMVVTMVLTLGILASGRYDGALYTWYAGIDPDDSSQLLCDQRPPHGYDWARYCNAQMDAAQAIALSHYDRPTRKRARRG